MNLLLVRTTFTPQSTIGTLFRNGEHQCFMLEDVCRETAPKTWHASMKVPGKTAIPYGRYEVGITFSDRFKKPLPLLMRVPDFEGIRIHTGNSPADTEGCLLPGSAKEIDWVTGSKAAFVELYGRIKAALEIEKVWIDIVKA